MCHPDKYPQPKGSDFPLGYLIGFFLFASIGLFLLGADSGQGIINGRHPFQIRLEAIETLALKIDEEAHTVERFCGVADTPSFPTTACSSETMSPHVLTSGDDDWGAWAFVIGSGDTPLISGKEAFDIHEIEIASVSTASFARLQIGWNATTTTAIIADNDYTEVVFQPSGIGANVSAGPIEIRMPDVDAGTLVWARIWIDGENAATADIFLGMHEFDE